MSAVNGAKAIPKKNKYGFDELALLRDFYEIMQGCDVVERLKDELLSEVLTVKPGEFWGDWDSATILGDLEAIVDALRLIEKPDDLEWTWYAYIIDAETSNDTM